MTPKEKRAFEAMEEILIGGPTECELAVVMRLIDAAERRGEERVLRWLRRQDFHGIVYNYKKWKLDLEYVLIDRRARGGKR